MIITGKKTQSSMPSSLPWRAAVCKVHDEGEYGMLTTCDREVEKRKWLSLSTDLIIRIG